MSALDEPVRGLIPPPWFRSLSGLERMRAWSTQLVPGPPATRLLGVRAVHVGPGLCVGAMPASEMLTGVNGQIETWLLLGTTLAGALVTAVGPGQNVRPLSLSANHFRPPRPGTGNLLARARVVNASSLFVYAEAMVEDSEGRQIAHGGGHAAIVTMDPPPPPPPSPLERIEEPSWPTPDPWQRPAGPNVPQAMWEARDGLDIVRDFAAGSLESPLSNLIDFRILHASEGAITATVPASEWFCFDTRTLPVNLLTTLGNLTGWACGLTMLRAGETVAGLDSHTRILREVPADGRLLRAEARIENQAGARADGAMVVSATVYDADGTQVTTTNAGAAILDNARRRRPRRRPVERMLCTILFTDIVDSTARAESLGDVAWGSLLERHHEVARQEIAFCQGREVKSTGDGLLVRFSSPARALECATRLRRSLAALDIEIRAGLHTGECEVGEDDIVGMAVHLAARIQAAAAPGEVLVSSTVKDLAAGAGRQFEDRGEHQLKGVEEPWRLWAVA